MALVTLRGGLLVAGVVSLIACEVRFDVGRAGPDSGPTQIAGGSPFFAVPFSARFSPGGRYLSYVAMHEVPDGGGAAFRSGPLVVRDLKTGSEFELRPAPTLNCTQAPCLFPEATQLVFDQHDTKVFVPNIRETGSETDWSLGEVVALPGGERTHAATVNSLASILHLAPDLSWAIVGQQNHLAPGGEIGFLAPLDGVVEPVVSTCVDPSRLSRDGVTSDSAALLVLENCTVVGPLATHSLQVYPMRMPSQTPPSRPAPTMLQDGKGFIGRLFVRPGKVFFTLGYSSSFHQPIVGGVSELIGAELLSVSPAGRWAALGATASGPGFARESGVLAITTGAVEDLGLIYFDRAKGSLPWVDDQTLIFKDPFGGVRRWVPGGAPVVLHASDAGVSSPLVPLRGSVGLLEDTASALVPYTLTVSDGSKSTQFHLPAQGVRAHLFGTGAPVDLGTASSWTLGPTFSLRGTFRFDAVGHPAPDNGFVLVATPASALSP